MSRKDTVLSRRLIEGLIANGASIIIVDRMVLKVDGWLKYHPGGLKPIQHMVGRDATDEVNRMHSRETLSGMARSQIGRIDGPWTNFVPPIQGGKYRSVLEVIDDAEDKGENSEISASSASPSVIFDSSNSELKHRSDSASSLSSTNSLIPQSGPSFLDSQTKLELELDLSKYPSVDAKTQDEIVRKYRLLEKHIENEGLYSCNYGAYLWEAARCSTIFVLMLFFWKTGWYAVSGAFMGMFWSQLVFPAHDAGHLSITHNYTFDTTIGMIIAASLGGLSMGWWKANHNVHHLVTNSIEHDPDNQHLPVLAVNLRFLSNIFSTYHEKVLPYDGFAQRVIPYQKYFYYPVLTLGRFNLYLQSYTFLLLGKGPQKGPAWWHRWFEIAGNVIFWVWFGWGIVGHIPGHWNRFVFVMISHMINVFLHLQLTLSHFAMSTADLGPGESFPQKMLRTTMDVDCPPWLDFIHGGLQFQAVHHLFPRIPRHNLRRTQKLVIEFCRDTRIPYALYGFVDGNRQVLGRLAEVSRQAAILMQCERAIATRGDVLP